MRRLLVISLILPVLALGACSRYASPHDIGISPSIQTSNYKAADELSAQAPGRDGAIAIATISDANNIETSSALGRMISDQLGARFVQLGYHVSEIRLRNDINVLQSADGMADGEYVLSRNRDELAARTNARHVVSGTYAVGANSVLVNLRMIDANTSRVLAAYDYTLPMNGDVRRLVETRAHSGDKNIFSSGWAK
jgi:TolB-like protein